MAKYNKEIVERIVGLIESDSYTIAEICKIVDIAESTYYEWAATKPEFSESIKKAQNNFDDKCVVEAKKSLAKLICGYTVDETKTVYTDGKDGKPRIKEQTITKKHIQPSLGATIFLLTNKDSDNWKNRQSNELTGKDGAPLLNKLEVVIVRNKKDIEDAKK